MPTEGDKMRARFEAFARIESLRTTKGACLICGAFGPHRADCSLLLAIEAASDYWQARAKTAELKVLTFHEEIVKLRAGAASSTEHREPDGYAHRYHDGIRYGTNGRAINGSDPIEAIPFWFHRPHRGEREGGVNEPPKR